MGAVILPRRSFSLSRKGTLLFAIVLLITPIATPGIGATAEKTVTQIFEEQGKAVIHVSNLGPLKLPQGLGSGFLVRPNGVFVTNFHVVERASSVQIKLPDGREFDVTGIVAKNPHLDLAILKVEAQELPVVTLGDSDAVKVGERVIAIGSPMGLENTVSDGLVSAIREDEPGEKLFQITSPVSPGSSGGPLFNTKGEVIGITFLQFPEGQSLNFAIPINYAKPLIRDGPIQAFEPDALMPKLENCPVIGNRRSGVYHLPGGQFYEQMKLSPDGVCFKSEEEALLFGFRRSQR